MDISFAVKVLLIVLMVIMVIFDIIFTIQNMVVTHKEYERHIEFLDKLINTENDDKELDLDEKK